MIPLINLQSNNKNELIQQIHNACIEYGFFYITGHGIKKQYIKQVFQQSKLLFNCTNKSKNNLYDPILNRGYTNMEEEILDPINQLKSGRGDTKEGYYIGNDITINNTLYNINKLSGPNIWPTINTCPELYKPNEFRIIMELYYNNMNNICIQILHLLALSLNLNEQYFDKYFINTNTCNNMSALRLLHYAAVTSIPQDGLFACGAHSDYGMLTLLITDGTPGLQILSPKNNNNNDNNNEEWIDVPPIPPQTINTSTSNIDDNNNNNNDDDDDIYYIVNLGDMLERWTNGLYCSTKHRVVTDGLKERYSIPFFYEPNFDTVVECIRSCCSDMNPSKYKPITSGQHLLDKYKQTHIDFKPA